MMTPAQQPDYSPAHGGKLKQSAWEDVLPDAASFGCIILMDILLIRNEPSPGIGNFDMRLHVYMLL